MRPRLLEKGGMAVLRSLLEKRLGTMSDGQFALVADLTTADIKRNRADFGKHTGLDEVLAVAEITFKVIKKAAS